MKFNVSIKARARFTIWTTIAILSIFLIGKLFMAVHAASPSTYSPLNVIGQYTAGGNPDFTNININGASSPNAEGFNEQYATIPDLANQRLFVADTGNNRVLIYPLTASGDLASRAATLVIGQADMASGDQSNTPSASSLANPEALAYDSAHDRLFVADSSNNRVLIYDLSGGITNGMAASNVLGQPDFASHSPAFGSFSASNMWNPRGLTYDSTNQRLFVGDDFDNRVLVFDLSGGVSNGMAASNVLGEPNFTTNSGFPGDSNFPGSPTHQVALPSGLAYDAVHSRLFAVNNSGSANPGANNVQVFDLSGGITNGMVASNVLGNPTGGDASASRFHNPGGLAYDPANDRLFLTDAWDNRIMVYNLSGGVINGMNANNVLGQSDLTGHDSHLDQRGFWLPIDVSYDSTHQRLWVSDQFNNRVMEFNLASGLSDNMAAIDALGQTTPAGSSTYNTDNLQNSQPLANSLNDPTDILVDHSNHRMFILDNTNARILVYDLNAQNQVTSNDASLVLGQTDFTSGPGVLATNDTAGNPHGFMTPNNINRGDYMAYDSVHQRLFVTETYPTQRVIIFDLSGGIIDGMAATHVLGRPSLTDETNFSFLGSPTATTIANPGGIAYDSLHQRLFVADTGNNRVMVFDLSGGIIDGMAASNVLGQPDLTSGNSNAGDTGLNTPEGLYYNAASQTLAVADANNNRVMLYDTSNGVTDNMPASTALGQPDFNSTGFDTTSTALNFPVAIAFDPDRNYFLVSDADNNRIVAYDASNGLATGQAAITVIGQPDLTSSDPAGGQGGLNFPGGIFYDTATSQLYITDGNNNRVMVYGTPAPAQSPPPSSSPPPSQTTSPPSSTSSGSKGSPSPAATSPAQPSTTSQPTNLTGINDFTNGQGYKTDVSPGQQFVFSPTDSSQTYTLTVDSISHTDMQLSSTPNPQDFLLFSGQSKNIDVNMDGTPDISLLATNLGQDHGRLKLALYHQLTLISTGAQTPIPQKWTRTTYFLVGFPYVLFAILFTIILVSLRTILREMAAARRLRKFYQLQEQVARQKGVFMQLAAHYLRTPLALIVAGEGMLAADGSGAKAAVAKLGSSIESLLSRVEAVNDQTTSTYVSLKRTRPPLALALKRPAFYVPISILIAAVTTFYWLLHLVHVNKQVANANLLIQATLTVLLGAILYAILRSTWLLGEEQAGLKAALQDQAHLDDKRSTFIRAAVTDLTARVDELATSSGQLQSKPIEEGVERLQKLLNRLGIVELLRLTPMPTSFQQFSVAGLLNNVQPIIAKASERNIAVALPPDNVVKTRNVAALMVVVQTLLDNAVSYSQDDSSIEIRTDAARDLFTLRVVDHGKGIPSQDKEQLFQPFTKVEGALSFEHEGAGLSLYLDQLIMTYLGGTIDLESEPGRGTQVSIELPQQE